MSQVIQVAIIAASAAISGAVITQITTFAISIWDKKHQKQVLLRQKYEEIMFAFQNSLNYVQDVQTCKTHDQLYQLSGSPHSGKACGLALLYFPSLVEPLNKYNSAQVSFYNSVVAIFNENNLANAGGQAVMIKSHRQLIDNLFKEKNLVLGALISNAEKYTKA